jgi:hypothetical protein
LSVIISHAQINRAPTPSTSALSADQRMTLEKAAKGKRSGRRQDNWE